MIDSRDFIIHQRFVLKAEQIDLEVLPGKKTYPPQIKKMINRAWVEATQNPAIKIFNGRVVSLCGVIQNSLDEAGVFKCQVQQTDYKSFYGTNVVNSMYIQDSSHLANALAACVVAETTDATIIVGCRSGNMAEGSGVWHVPGGTLEFPETTQEHKDLKKLLKLPYTRAAALNPVLTMMRELREELNIASGDIIEALCLGLGENLQMKKPEFLCYFRLGLSSDEVQEAMSNAVDRDEHGTVSFVPVEDIMDFCRTYRFAPIGIAAITRYWEYQSEKRPNLHL
ncbi:MAG: NUDIX hydrolase [Candidatus Cloacimonadaceae bacterium]|nr:NUDIX hydrolase [Candidatus Cloacimonadaceae bacterium]